MSKRPMPTPSIGMKARNSSSRPTQNVEPVKKEWDVFWESNPTNIKSPVFWENTAITLIFQKTQRDPILPMFSLCLSTVGVWEIH